ncbi:MAG: PfkB family carbohydrate kinase [Acidobacteriota bacterium]|jgi:sugar/nucleoside kinase (ribokinase family)
MRVAVVGSMVADTIEHTDGSVTDSLGGIAHAVAVLAALVGEEHTILPLCRVGNDCRVRVEQWAAGLAGVDLAAVDFAAAPTPRVRLSYGEAPEAGERVERIRGPLSPLQAADVVAAAGADIVLANCITGADCTPATIAALRAATSRLYLDVHSLALGHAADGARFYRARDDWESWLRHPDVAQCNRGEAATICGLPAKRAGKEEVIAALTDRMQQAATPMPPVWLLTLGADGGVLLQRHGDEINRADIIAPTVDAIDPTGAGDACGAGYVAAGLSGATPLEAARQAIRTASAATTIPGSPEPTALRRVLESLAQT